MITLAMFAAVLLGAGPLLLIEADENISVLLLVGSTQATAADVLRSLGLDREPAHEAVGAAARRAT